MYMCMVYAGTHTHTHSYILIIILMIPSWCFAVWVKFKFEEDQT